MGDLDGTSDRVFGSLVDAVVLPNGYIAVLDAHYGLLRILSPNLHAVATFGGLGDGPGEFVEPASVFQADPGQLTVLDVEGNRLETFGWRQDGPVVQDEPVASTRLRLRLGRTYDACAVGGRRFALGILLSDETGLAELESTATIHEFDASGQIVRSFGEPYAYLRDPLVADVYAAGRLACDSAVDGRIFVSYATLGQVHAWSAAGELRWIAELADFEYPRQRHVPGVSIGTQPRQEIRHIEHINSVSLLSPSVLAVQVHSRQRPADGSRQWQIGYRLYLLDPDDGALIDGFEANHQVLGGSHGMAILYNERPHPRIAVVDIHRHVYD